MSEGDRASVAVLWYGTADGPCQAGETTAEDRKMVPTWLWPLTIVLLVPTVVGTSPDNATSLDVLGTLSSSRQRARGKDCFV